MTRKNGIFRFKDGKRDPGNHRYGKTMQISSNISSSGMALGWPTRSCCCQRVHENS